MLQRTPHANALEVRGSVTAADKPDCWLFDFENLHSVWLVVEDVRVSTKLIR